MWIVRLALRRPYTFAVVALLLMILGPLAILSMPVDIFPDVNIPVIAMIWNYTGFSPFQMANRMITLSERSLTTTVNDIDHIESTSLNGSGIIKIYFQPGVNIGNAVAQVTAIAQTQIRQMPQGTTPPLIIQYNASSVPIIQLALSGHGLTESQLNDLALNFVRTQLITVPGAGVPYPYGGKQRQVQVDLNIPALQAKGLAPADVVNTIAAQNLILPTGTIKIGPFEYQLESNSAPLSTGDLNRLPIREANGSVVYVGDVAHVHIGSPPQTNIVRVDGQRAALLSVEKTGNASTLNIVKGVLAKLPQVKAQLPPQLRITPLADQSIFVKASIDGVVHEAIIAAVLTALMILVFLGSFRSTLIVAVSIPLSILTSLVVLRLIDGTINIMTLGGLALAVGILVDDATVAIENINRNLEMGKALEPAILDGSAQIAVPALVATLSICIVFVPMFFLSGVPRYLFVPLAEAVVFAMLASYLLSRTVVPMMAKYLLHEHDETEAEQKHRSRNPWTRFQLGFERHFERIRGGYRGILDLCMRHAAVFLTIFFVFTVGSAALLYPWLGENFFPSVDAGQFKLHVRARTGTRIEDMADLCDRIDNTIRQVIPKDQLASVIDNIGLPYSGINLTYSNSAPIGPGDADIQVSLTAHHRPTAEYVERLRQILPQRFPGTEFYTLPVDMVTQILNFGLPSPIDVQILGPNLESNRMVAYRMLNRIKYVPGVSGARIQQPFDQPELTVNVDRSMSQMAGVNDRDVMQSLLAATSGSFQTAPEFWLDPRNDVEYDIAAQSPQFWLDTIQELNNIPIVAGSGNGRLPSNSGSYGAGMPPGNGIMGGPPTQMVGNLATLVPGEEMGTVTHYNIAPSLDIYGNVVGTDLGSVDKGIEKIVAQERPRLPRGSRIVVRGQVVTMRSAYSDLLAGLVFSILLVYLLIVVNFQSWLDPFIIITALPAAISGIVWILFLTHTTLSVPALTGAIMCMGVATSNSILVVSFAREQLEETVGDAAQSALNAGYVRFRPVLMTALAMMIGMVPMALGLGSGGEQNAPLGRAVIGGLLFATVSTLFFVPTVFSVLHGRRERRRSERDWRRQEAAGSEA